MDKFNLILKYIYCTNLATAMLVLALQDDLEHLYLVPMSSYVLVPQASQPRYKRIIFLSKFLI